MATLTGAIGQGGGGPSFWNVPDFAGGRITGSYEGDIANQGRQNQQLQAQQAKAQQQLQAQQQAAAQRLQDQQLGWQRDRFNTVFGAFSNQMGSLNSALQSSVGGSSGQGPNIGGGPMWNQQQIQQQLNANRAQIDNSVATQNRTSANSLAGRGFGPRSPLAAALATQAGMGGMAQKADFQRQFVPQAMQQNAQMGLDTGRAREQQFANRQNEDIERRRTVSSQQTSLLNALANFA